GNGCRRFAQEIQLLSTAAGALMFSELVVCTCQFGCRFPQDHFIVACERASLFEQLSGSTCVARPKEAATLAKMGFCERAHLGRSISLKLFFNVVTAPH